MDPESRRKEILARHAYHFIVNLADLIQDPHEKDSFGPTNLRLEFNCEYRWKVHSKLFKRKSSFLPKDVTEPANTKPKEPWNFGSDWACIYVGDDPVWLARVIHYMYTGDYVYTPGSDVSAKRRLSTLLNVALESLDSTPSHPFRLAQLLPPSIALQQPQGQDEEDTELDTDIDMFKNAERWDIESLKVLARTILLARLERNKDRKEYIAKTYPKIYEALEREFDENWHLSGDRLVDVLVQYMRKLHPHDPSNPSGTSRAMLDQVNESIEQSDDLERNPEAKVMRDFHESIRGYTTKSGNFAENLGRRLETNCS